VFKTQHMRVNIQQPTRNIQPNIGGDIQTKAYKEVPDWSARLTFFPWILDIPCWLLGVEIPKTSSFNRYFCIKHNCRTFGT